MALGMGNTYGPAVGNTFGPGLGNTYGPTMGNTFGPEWGILLAFDTEGVCRFPEIPARARSSSPQTMSHVRHPAPDTGSALPCLFWDDRESGV